MSVRSTSMRTSRASGTMRSAMPSGTMAPSNMPSNMPSRTRYTLASGYSNTNVTPLHKEVSNVPISTMTATGLAAVCYVAPVIMMLVVKCPFTREVVSFFSFLLIALLALATMAGLNMLFPRYRFNCMSLSVSLVYSGSIALIIYGLTETAFYGLCWPSNYVPSSGDDGTTDKTTVATDSTTTVESITKSLIEYVTSKSFVSIERNSTIDKLSGSDGQTKPVGIFKSGSVSNYFIWALSAVGVCFQIVAHYFYG